MKKALVVMSVLFLAVLSVDVFAIGNIGTPTAELNKGQWSVGWDYAYSDKDLDASKMKYKDSTSGPGKTAFDFENVRTNFYYATLGYGLTDDWEVYGLLGIADICGEVRWPEYSSRWEGCNFDNDIAGGFGTRYTFYKDNKVRWGATTQMNWIDTSFNLSPTGYEIVSLNAYELLVAIGPTVDMGGWKLYGGPFFYMINGHAKDKETWSDGSWWKGSSDVEAENNFGGYIGMQLDLTKKCDLKVEFFSIGDGWGLGTGVIFKF
jgi:hypothetical protein